MPATKQSATQRIPCKNSNISTSIGMISLHISANTVELITSPAGSSAARSPQVGPSEESPSPHGLPLPPKGPDRCCAPNVDVGSPTSLSWCCARKASGVTTCRPKKGRQGSADQRISMATLQLYIHGAPPDQIAHRHCNDRQESTPEPAFPEECPETFWLSPSPWKRREALLLGGIW